MGQEKWRVEKTKMTDRSGQARTTEGTEMTGENGWGGVRRLEGDRRDYGKSSSSATKCPLITFPTISPSLAMAEVWNHQYHRHAGLIAARSGSSDRQGHRLSAVADIFLWQFACPRPAEIWIWAFQQRDSRRRCDQSGGCSCWSAESEWRARLSQRQKRRRAG